MNDYFKPIIYLLALIFVLLLACIPMTEFGRRLASGTFKPFLLLWEKAVQAGDRVTGKVFATDAEREEKLREEKLGELLEAVRSSDKIREENRQLRRMMELEPPKDWRALYAQVILRDPLTWNRCFMVSRGSKDGVRLGNPVLFQDVLIGRVTEIFQETAKVSTLASPECKCSVFVVGEEGEEYPGIFRGESEANGSGIIFCSVDYLPKLAVIRDGALVVTSGLGVEIPYGIPMGVVIPQADGSGTELVDNARRRVQVRPAADFRKLYFVTILTTQKPETEIKNE